MNLQLSNTSYRDAFKLFLVFCETDRKMKADKIRISDLTPELLTEYLAWLERVRHCGVRTRNQRLAAFKSFFHYVASMQPEHILNCQRILDLPMKKAASRAMNYFSPEGLPQRLLTDSFTTLKSLSLKEKVIEKDLNKIRLKP